jgi:mercuric reductase
MCDGPTERGPTNHLKGISVDVVGDTAQTLRSSHLLVATGRVPNTEGLGLEVAGVRTDRQSAIIVDEELRTSAPHVWAAGDVIGSNTESQMATPVGAQDGGIAAVNALAGEHRRLDVNPARTWPVQAWPTAT